MKNPISKPHLFAEQFLVATNGVLDGHSDGVSDVQVSGHIWGRQNHRKSAGEWRALSSGYGFWRLALILPLIVLFDESDGLVVEGAKRGQYPSITKNLLRGLL